MTSRTKNTKKSPVTGYVGIGEKPMNLESWRELPEEQKVKLTKDIILRIYGGQKQETISEETHIGRHIITRLAENNGLAQRGQYRRRDPIVFADPVVTDIDATPNPAVTLAGQRAEEAELLEEDTETNQDFIEPKAAIEETNVSRRASSSNTSNLVKEMQNAISDIKRMCSEEFDTELVEVLIVTKSVTFSFKA